MKLVIALLLSLLPVLSAAAERPFLRGSWAALLAAHHGHATIVHFWGVTCGPCLRELPEWAAFKAAHPGIDLVLVEADPVPETADAAATPLAKAGLGAAESWGFADPFTERLEYEVDPSWHGELPFTVLVGRDGSSTSLLGAADFAAMVKWLDHAARS
jgi:hypothetical protein